MLVRLFDILGSEIKLFSNQTLGKIFPILGAPILTPICQVSVTWVDSQNVWLQRISDKDSESKQLDDLFEHYQNSTPCLTDIIEDFEVYAAVASDGNWYRAKVICKVGADSAKIRLLDYGNVEIVPIANLRPLAPQFYILPQLALPVSLFVDFDSDNAEKVSVISELVDEKEFEASLSRINNAWFVELLSPTNEKLSDLLLAKKCVKPIELQSPDSPKKLLEGGEYEMIISHVNHPQEFWMRRKDDLVTVTELQKILQKLAPSCEDLDRIPEPLESCLALNSLDSHWYRAEVLDADSDIVTVRFIDYGNTDVVDLGRNQIKKIPDDLKAQSGLAYKLVDFKSKNIFFLVNLREHSQIT